MSSLLHKWTTVRQEIRSRVPYGSQFRFSISLSGSFRATQAGHFANQTHAQFILLALFAFAALSYCRADDSLEEALLQNFADRCGLVIEKMTVSVSGGGRTGSRFVIVEVDPALVNQACPQPGDEINAINGRRFSMLAVKDLLQDQSLESLSVSCRRLSGLHRSDKGSLWFADRADPASEYTLDLSALKEMDQSDDSTDADTAAIPEPSEPPDDGSPDFRNWRWGDSADDVIQAEPNCQLEKVNEPWEYPWDGPEVTILKGNAHMAIGEADIYLFFISDRLVRAEAAWLAALQPDRLLGAIQTRYKQRGQTDLTPEGYPRGTILVHWDTLPRSYVTLELSVREPRLVVESKVENLEDYLEERKRLLHDEIKLQNQTDSLDF